MGVRLKKTLSVFLAVVIIAVMPLQALAVDPIEELKTTIDFYQYVGNQVYDTIVNNWINELKGIAPVRYFYGFDLSNIQHGLKNALEAGETFITFDEYLEMQRKIAEGEEFTKAEYKKLKDATAEFSKGKVEPDKILKSLEDEFTKAYKTSVIGMNGYIVPIKPFFTHDDYNPIVHPEGNYRVESDVYYPAWSKVSGNYYFAFNDTRNTQISVFGEKVAVGWFQGRVVHTLPQDSNVYFSYEHRDIGDKQFFFREPNPFVYQTEGFNVRGTQLIMASNTVHMKGLAVYGNSYFSLEFRACYIVQPVGWNSINGDFGTNTRPGSYPLNGVVVDDVGNRVTVPVVPIIDEIGNTYNNPATGESQAIENWTYDYSDNSYTVTTTNGDTVTITYGSEYITINENNTTVNYIYYLGSGDGSGSDPEGPQEPVNPGDGGGDGNGDDSGNNGNGGNGSGNKGGLWWIVADFISFLNDMLFDFMSIGIREFLGIFTDSSSDIFGILGG